MRDLFNVENHRTGNLASMLGIFPDYAAPIIHVHVRKRKLSMYR